MRARQWRLIIFIIGGIGIVCFTSILPATLANIENAAIVYAWQQNSTADWQFPSSWTPERTNPASSDILVFNSGGATTATNIPTQTIGQLMVSGNTTVNLQSNGAVVLTVMGDSGDDLDVGQNSTLNFNGSNAITANLASGSTARINGVLKFSSNGTADHKLTALDEGAVIFGEGSVFTAGLGFAGNPFGTTNLDSVNFENGATYVCISGGDPFGAAEPSSVVVFKKGSLFSLRTQLSFSQTSFSSGRTYANFELNYPGGYSHLRGTSALVMDDLSVNAGDLELGVNNSPGHSINGNITVLPGAELIFQTSFPGHVINLNGNAPQTITNSGSVSVNPGNTLAIDNALGVTAINWVAWNLKLMNGIVTVPNPADYFRVPGTVTRVNGYINGGMSRDLNLNQERIFDVGTTNGYSPVSVKVTAGNDFPQGMLVWPAQSAQPNVLLPSKSLSRYWKVIGGTNIASANLTFSYLDPTDIPPTADESNFLIGRYTNGFALPAGVVDTQANTFTATGQGNFFNSFTHFTLAEPASFASPTPTSTPTASPTPTATPICPPVVLFDQSGGATGGVNSQDFDTANDAFDSQAADDFVVPAGQVWTVEKVVVDGLYFNGTGPVDSFNVTFYTDAAMFPGSVVAGGTFTGAAYSNAAGVFTITLPSSLALSSGTYWVSVQARMNGVPGGQWAWLDRAVITGSPAVWKNPGGGFNIPACVGWARRGATCMIDPAAPDQVFQLIGTIGVCMTPTASATNTSTNTPSATASATATPLHATVFDYDGDRKSDVSVFRPAGGTWYVERSRDGFYGVQFGLSNDRITPADFDGDGRTDIAVYRPSTGIWYWFNSSDSTFNAVQFGVSEDLPTPADYDGDGLADVSVFRPSTGTWYRLNSGSGFSFFGAQFGVSEDKPTVGDFDGDAKADIAVWRPSSGIWYRLNSSDSAFVAYQFGLSEDLIVPADYDGDGKTDYAVYRPSSGVWFMINSSNGAFAATQFGLPIDVPSPGDFDGDGRADICVWRPTDGTWYRLIGSNGQFVAFQFGTNGDRPTQAAFRY